MRTLFRGHSVSVLDVDHVIEGGLDYHDKHNFEEKFRDVYRANS